mmetsp:Transcript_58317/g.165838  ORF Transcript_58317/g.165838 Transcript_58317/m.165838 type:complete len:250 (-) Transcript_58317:183-932(-)
MLPAARNAAEGAALFKPIQRVDVLSSRRPAAAREGDADVWPAERNQIQPRWVPVLVRPHGNHRVLPRETQVIHLARAGVLARRLVAAIEIRGVDCGTVAAPVESNFGVVAAEAHKVGADVAAVDRCVGNLEPLAQFPRAGVDDLDARLPAARPSRSLGHGYYLLLCDAQVHRKAGRLVELHALDLEERPLASTATPWKPAVAVQVQVLSFLVSVEVGRATPLCQAKESPHLVTDPQVAGSSVCSHKPDD